MTASVNPHPIASTSQMHSRQRVTRGEIDWHPPRPHQPAHRDHVAEQRRRDREAPENRARQPEQQGHAQRDGRDGERPELPHRAFRQMNLREQKRGQHPI
jgi:hypothetical protein